MALLILLWGLLLSFVVIQYGNEKRHAEEILDTRLQLLNTVIISNLSTTTYLDTIIKNHIDDLNGLAVVVCRDSCSVNHYNSTQGVVSKRVESMLLSNLNSDDECCNKHIISDNYIYSLTYNGDTVVCSSLPYSLNIIDVIKMWNISFIVAVVISIIISIIGFITTRLFTMLEQADKDIIREQATALHEEQDKIRLKRQLTNNINHEIKTPICSIMGYLEMIINNENLDVERCRSFVAKSYDQAERLRSLMADLSTITRMDEASAMISRESVSLGELIENLIDDVLPQADKQNIRIITNVNGELPVNGSNTLLYSIFRNLIDNAIAYSGGRHIWVELLGEGDKFYSFSIRDNGIGVEEHHIPYLFERFYRVDKGRSRKLGGTGLGLSIVKNAVVLHGGTITAQIWDMGGLDFRFTIAKS